MPCVARWQAGSFQGQRKPSVSPEKPVADDLEWGFRMSQSQRNVGMVEIQALRVSSEIRGQPVPLL